MAASVVETLVADPLGHRDPYGGGVTVDEGGDFWLPKSPDTTVRGRFTRRSGEDPQVTLEGNLVDDPRLRPFPGGVGFSGTAEDSIASFLPITLHGRLDTGEHVTLLNARNHGGSGGLFFSAPPRYVCHTAVAGDHVDDDQLFAATRFRLGHRYWFDHLQPGDSETDPDGGFTVSVDGSTDGNWLVYTRSAPATLRRLEAMASSGVLALLRLALDVELVASDTEVRAETDGPWLLLQDDGLRTVDARLKGDPLLPREVLTLERIANWIPLNDKLDGLAWAVIDPVGGALQAQTLVITSVVEGIHRRLPYEQSKFPGMTRETRKAILEAARAAAIAEAAARGVDAQTVTDSLQFLTDVSFRSRAIEIVEQVCAVVPEINESLVDLPGQITKGRNDFAHHLLLDRNKEPLEVSYLRWLILTTITPWLLRGLLLLHAGISADVLHTGYAESNRFEHVRANTAQYVRELGWELPPRPAPNTP